MRMHVLGPGLVFWRRGPAAAELLPLAEIFAADEDDKARLELIKQTLALGEDYYLVASVSDENDANFSHVYLVVMGQKLFLGVIDERTGQPAMVAT